MRCSPLFKKNLFPLFAYAPVFVSCCFLATQSYSQAVSAEWQYEYSYAASPHGGFVDSNDVYHVLVQKVFGNASAHLLAIDSSGNLVGDETIAGNPLTSIYLDKKLNSYFLSPLVNKIYSFDANGSERWHVTLPFSSYNMVVDDAGSSYVVASYFNDGSHKHIAAMKIDSSGNLLWTAYPVPGNISEEECHAMLPDNQGGLYITGDIQHDGQNNIFYTLKINSDGSIGWTHEAGYDSYISIAMAIAADDFNNTYITGYARGSNKDKSVTIKFSSAGVVQWTRIDSADYMLPYDIALDAGNNVIVFGERDLTMFVTKYDNSGSELWSTDFTALSGIDVWPLSMAIDQFDNILMLGASETGDYWENYNYTTVKYSPSGVLQWYADYDNSYDTNSEDKLQLAGFDSYGNVIVTGYTEDDASLDFFKVDVIKYEKGAVVTGIENPTSQVSVFPNPFHQIFQLELMGNEDHLTLELYNALGEMVLHKEISGRQAMINTGITSPGMYLAILKKDSKIISKFKMVAD